MTIYVIIPVFNRLELTQRLINCLWRQVLSCPLKIVVINDGSTDNTAKWLSSQNDLIVLNGDGFLLWGGAIDLAIKYLKIEAREEDWVLLLNNDTTVEETFVQDLLNAALANPNSAVGCVVRDETNHSLVLSIGPCLDLWRFGVKDLVDILSSLQFSTLVIDVKALAGRGVLYPLAALNACGGMRSRLIPHYLADYELSLRVKKAGWRLLVATRSNVYSQDGFGSQVFNSNFIKKLFSRRSPYYLPAQLIFWWEASSWLQRLTLPIRLPMFFLFPSLRRARP